MSVNATPSAKTAAEEAGIDLNDVPGTGAGGRVTKKDIDEYLTNLPDPPETAVESDPAETAVNENEPAATDEGEQAQPPVDEVDPPVIKDEPAADEAGPDSDVEVEEIKLPPDTPVDVRVDVRQTILNGINYNQGSVVTMRYDQYLSALKLKPEAYSVRLHGKGGSFHKEL